VTNFWRILKQFFKWYRIVCPLRFQNPTPLFSFFLSSPSSLSMPKLSGNTLLCWNRACVEIFVLRKDKPEKPVTTQNIVLKITQICVAVTQHFLTQARFKHKSHFEHKNFVYEESKPTFSIQVYFFCRCTLSLHKFTQVYTSLHKFTLHMASPFGITREILLLLQGWFVDQCPQRLNLFCIRKNLTYSWFESETFGFHLVMLSTDPWRSWFTLWKFL
jgi:hypothetical protein